MDLGVDLCLAQLLEERAVETTWPRVQPHLGHLLTKRLNSMTKKCPQKVHTIIPTHHSCWMTLCKGCSLLRSFLATPYPQLGWGTRRLLVNMGSGASALFLR
jgi:hypothetical protein